jgi:hypothetical protein
MWLAQADEPTNLSELLQSMPAVWTLVLAALLVVGLVLWVFGGKMAKAGVMVSGFVLGGLCAMALAAALGEPGEAGLGGSGLWIMAIGIGGALAGLLLAALLFRVWMGATAALLLAAVVPAAAMVWQGNAPPLSAVRGTQTAALDAMGAGESDPTAEAIREQVEQFRASVHGDEAADPESADTAMSAEQLADALFDQEQFRDELAGVWSQQVEEVKAWWRDLPAGQRRFLLAGSAVGGVVGLILGLIVPLIAAAVQSALVGGILILFAGRALLLQYVPAAAGVMPDSWRGVLLSLGLITLLGILIQWSLRAKKDDE